MSARLALFPVLAAPALLTAVPALALDTACRFTVECYEAEACDAADFTLRLRPGDAPDTVRLGGPVDDITGAVTEAESGARVVVARGPSSVQLLTLGPDSTARYTLHLTDGPAIVSYHGTCEDE